jgi:hypothetical protein
MTALALLSRVVSGAQAPCLGVLNGSSAMDPTQDEWAEEGVVKVVYLLT